MQPRPDQTTATMPLPAATSRLNWKEALLLVTCFGLLTGLLEAAIKATMRFGFHQIIQSSRDVYWMAPLASVIVFLFSGLGIYLLGRVWPRFDGRSWLLFILGFQGFLSLLFHLPQLHHYSAVVLAAGGGWQVSRYLSAHFDRHRRLMPRLAWVMLGAVAIIAILARGNQAMEDRQAAAKLPPPSAGPNVLLIVLDTVRAQNLSLYGYNRATTPNLELLSKRGVAFEQALSTAPWTLPSHASMFTGRFPHELTANWRIPMDRVNPTLAEQLSNRGYLTGGFVANTGYCNYEQGLDRGFITYEDYAVSFGLLMDSLSLVYTAGKNSRLRGLIRNDQRLDRQSAAEINQKFLSWLPRHGERPFFAFLNYFDAHDPYLPPAPFDRMFGPGRKDRYLSPMLHTEVDQKNNYQLPSAAQQEEIDAYDGAIAYLDHQLGALFNELKNRGLLDGTIIIVTSDHGEEFGEHGLYRHGNSLYLPSVHVPLLISFPPAGTAGQRITEPVTLRDLPATIQEMMGLPDRFPGQSLTRHWISRPAPERVEPSPLWCSVRQVENVPARFPASKGDMHSLVGNGHHYIRNGDGSEELYNLEWDPWEQDNLAGRRESLHVLEQLRAQLNAAMTPPPPNGAKSSPDR